MPSTLRPDLSAGVGSNTPKEACSQPSWPRVQPPRRRGAPTAKVAVVWPLSSEHPTRGATSLRRCHRGECCPDTLSRLAGAPTGFSMRGMPTRGRRAGSPSWCGGQRMERNREAPARAARKAQGRRRRAQRGRRGAQLREVRWNKPRGALLGSVFVNVNLVRPKTAPDLQKQYRTVPRTINMFTGRLHTIFISSTCPACANESAPKGIIDQLCLLIPLMPHGHTHTHVTAWSHESCGILWLLS